MLTVINCDYDWTQYVSMVYMGMTSIIFSDFSFGVKNYYSRIACILATTHTHQTTRNLYKIIVCVLFFVLTTNAKTENAGKISHFD